MDKSLKFISVSHETASVVERERFFIPEPDKKGTLIEIGKQFPDISGLLLLVTCNRTEIYFESVSTPAALLRDFVIAKQVSQIQEEKRLFRTGESTEKTVQHLLQVSSGLSSQVLGDAEIVHQIKRAYHLSREMNFQGSILERAMQTVFKTHKRISNETGFRDGTTSTAYKSLKVISEVFRGDHPTLKKILIVGAGDIVRQLLKYNSKFSFRNIYLSNRTEEKAIALASKHNCKLFEWSRVLANDFEDFDVLIGAAANCPHLIHEIRTLGQKRLMIDLALPGNMDSKLSEEDMITFFDLDAISAELEETKDKRLAAIANVRTIINDELEAFLQWYNEAPLRAFLSEYKIILQNKVSEYLDENKDLNDRETVSVVTDRIIRKLIQQNTFVKPPKELLKLIEKEARIV